MRLATILSLCLIALSASSQDVDKAVCGLIIGQTPFYERILLPKGDPFRPPTLRGVDDLGPEEQYSETNRIDVAFADPSRERTNGFFASLLDKVPIDELSLRSPGNLLTSHQVRELLRYTVVVPRSAWTNHMAHGQTGDRYVFSLIGSNDEVYVIDERMGSCALVFFPDGRYQCVMAPGYFCLRKL